MRLIGVVALAVLVLSYGADLAAEKNSARGLRPVHVRIERTSKEIKARLVRMSPETVTLLIEDREVTFPIDRVERITARRWDSPLGGALIVQLQAR